MNKELTDAKRRRVERSVLVNRLIAEINSVSEPEVSIIESVEFRRDQYGLRAKEFAKVLGISKTHYSEFVNGRRKLSQEAVKRARIIGVPPKVLFHPKQIEQ